MILTAGQIALMTICSAQILGIYIVFAMQFRKIIKNRNVAGISQIFVIFGNFQYICIFANAVIYYLAAFRACGSEAAVLCINDTLGFYQLLSGYLINVVFTVIYLVYRKVDQDNHLLPVSNSAVVDNSAVINSSHKEVMVIVNDGNVVGTSSGSRWWSATTAVTNAVTNAVTTAVTNAITDPLIKPLQIETKLGNAYPLHFIVIMLVNVGILTVVIALISMDNWTGYPYMTKIADMFGYISVAAILTQYLPQLYNLYRSKDASNLTLLTYLLPGGGCLITFLYLRFQGIVGFTTWLPYLVEGCVQLTLALQIIYYDKLYRRFHHQTVAVELTVAATVNSPTVIDDVVDQGDPYVQIIPF